MTGASIAFAPSPSDQIREARFGPAEAANAEPQEKRRDREACSETRQIELALPAEDAPAKPVDNPDHRVERIDKPPFLRHNVGAEPDRRDVEAELHDEGNNITEITVFDVKRGDP